MQKCLHCCVRSVVVLFRLAAAMYPELNTHLPMQFDTLLIYLSKPLQILEVCVGNRKSCSKGLMKSAVIHAPETACCCHELWPCLWIAGTWDGLKAYQQYKLDKSQPAGAMCFITACASPELRDARAHLLHETVSAQSHICTALPEAVREDVNMQSYLSDPTEPDDIRACISASSISLSSSQPDLAHGIVFAECCIMPLQVLLSSI